LSLSFGQHILIGGDTMLRTLLEKARNINLMYSEGHIDYVKYKSMKQQVIDETEASVIPIVANYFIV
jgi:GTP-sensing pleiotropic transcriptional regulator CodY